MYPTGMIKNTATNRFHPVSFRPAPLPGGSDIPRYKSAGHHTVGFDTEEEAIGWVKSSASMILVPNRYEWEGEDVPALVDFFTDASLTDAVKAQAQPTPA